MMKVTVSPRLKSLSRASEYCRVHASRPKHPRRAEQGNQAVRRLDRLKRISPAPCSPKILSWLRAMFLSDLQCTARARRGRLQRQTSDFPALADKTLARFAPV